MLMKLIARYCPVPLIVCVSFAAIEPKATASSAEDLVVKLSSDSLREREEATRALWEKGEAVLDVLRAASLSDDPERAQRAASVLEKVGLRITPKTPPAIFEQIRRYRTAPQNLKAKHINELRRMRAYFQILKLYSTEKSPAVKKEMAVSIRGIAMLAAREAIASDDFQTALKLLKMSAKEPNDLIALAWVYRCMGKLGEGMEDPPTPDDVATEDWKITLLRVKGDLDGALLIAEESQRPQMAASLKVLKGDPTAWMRQNGYGQVDSQVLQDYVEIALKRWDGKNVTDSDYAPLIQILKTHSSNNQEQAVSSLAALGRMGEAEKWQAKERPTQGFQYFLSHERIGEALETLGLDPQKPNYTAWAKERFNKLMEKNENHDGDGSPLSDLLMLACFLETRAQAKELDEAYSAPLAEYAQKFPEGFKVFMSSLFNSEAGAPDFAAKIGAVWAGEDEKRWQELFATAFGETQQVMEWQAWITEIEPSISREHQFRMMMAFFDIGVDAQVLSAKWKEKAWKVFEMSEGVEKRKHLEKIRMLAISQQDVATALKTRDVMDVKSRAFVTWPSIDKYYSASSRWKEAAEMFEGRRFGINTSPDHHAYLAVTMRKAGLENRAKKHEALAEKLSLGFAPLCARIGNVYVYGGDVKRAAEWYRRASLHADVETGDFVAMLGNYARSLFEENHWEMAASCYEVLAQANASKQFSATALSTASLSQYSMNRLNADLAKALALLPKDRKRAIALLEGIHQNFKGNGILGDDFFPMLRKVGLTEELEKWFGESWELISAVIERFPNNYNTLNTAAWLASRARMKLPEAEKHLQNVLSKKPDQAAYLDTMAEVRFAMGDRNGAVKWSRLSLLHYPLIDPPYDTMIRKQHQRFINESLRN